MAGFPGWFSVISVLLSPKLFLTQLIPSTVHGLQQEDSETRVALECPNLSIERWTPSSAGLYRFNTCNTEPYKWIGNCNESYTGYHGCNGYRDWFNERNDSTQLVSRRKKKQERNELIMMRSFVDCSDLFICANNDCIQSSLECDGNEDCTDGSDESHCLAREKSHCGVHDFHCADGGCVDAKVECDWYSDCADESDEHDNCLYEGFECDEGNTVIPYTWACDEEVDCDDERDENSLLCYGICDGHICDNDTVCVERDNVCDGYTFHCEDHSDEDTSLCPQFQECFYCNDFCIQWEWVCDNLADCEDYSEEKLIGCGRVADRCWQGGFLCMHGSFCVPQEWRCDGHNDCGDDSDEDNCLNGVSEFKVNSWGVIGGWSSWSEWSNCDAECGAGERSRHRVCLDPQSKCDDQEVEFETCENDCYVEADSGCGTRKSNSLQRIVGGEPSRIGSWPWQVQLVYSYNSGAQQVVCGGSLVGPKHVISAAHCFVGSMNNIKKWKVRLGKFLLNNQPELGAVESRVRKIIVHPQFDPETMDNDIALLVLRANIHQATDTINYVCVDKKLDFTEGAYCFVTGWGVTKMEGSQSQFLQEAYVPLISKTVCNAPSAYEGYVNDNMLCAGHMNGMVDACQGDSGGPLVCLHSDGHWYLVGITSWGYGCALKDKPGIYTNLQKYVDWAEENIGSSLLSP